MALEPRTEIRVDLGCDGSARERAEVLLGTS